MAGRRAAARTDRRRDASARGSPGWRRETSWPSSATATTRRSCGAVRSFEGARPDESAVLSDAVRRRRRDLARPLRQGLRHGVDPRAGRSGALDRRFGLLEAGRPASSADARSRWTVVVVLFIWVDHRRRVDPARRCSGGSPVRLGAHRVRARRPGRRRAASLYRTLLPVRSATGSALALRTESFRRFLAASEGRHVEWAWKQGLLREYSAWAVALGAATAWERALAASSVPPVEYASGPLLVYSMGRRSPARTPHRRAPADRAAGSPAAASPAAASAAVVAAAAPAAGDDFVSQPEVAKRARRAAFGRTVEPTRPPRTRTSLREPFAILYLSPDIRGA